MSKFFLYSLLIGLVLFNVTILTMWEMESEAFDFRAEYIYYDGCAMKGSGFELETGIIERCKKLSKEYGRYWRDAGKE